MRVSEKGSVVLKSVLRIVLMSETWKPQERICAHSGMIRSLFTPAMSVQAYTDVCVNVLMMTPSDQ